MMPTNIAIACLLTLVPVPPRPIPATGWVDQTIIVISNGIDIGTLNERKQLSPTATLNGLDYRVLGERDEFIEVKTREGIRGWLPKKNAVLLEDAVAYFSRRIAQNPNDLDAFNRRAWSWKLKGEHDPALKDMAEAIRLGPQAALFNNRALIWIAKSDYDHAIEDYTQAISLDPRFYLPYSNRALMWHAKKDYEKAIADFDQALRLNSQFAGAYRNRGVTRQSQRQYDLAIADFGEALRIDPQFVAAMADRGGVWMEKGDLAKAKADLDEALRIDPRYEPAHLIRGRLLARQKVPDQAMNAFDEAIRLNPRYSAALVERGALWRQRKNHDKAWADLDRALQLDAQNADVSAAVALFLASCPDGKHRDGKRALSLAQRAHEQHKTSVLALEALAAAHAELGLFTEAVQWQQRALDDPHAKNNDAVRRRLELYRKAEPYRHVD